MWQQYDASFRPPALVHRVREVKTLVSFEIADVQASCNLFGNFKRPVISIVWCLRGCWCGMLDEGGLLKVVVVVVIEEGVAVLVRRGCSSSGSSKTSRCSSSMSVYW